MYVYIYIYILYYICIYTAIKHLMGIDCAAHARPPSYSRGLDVLSAFYISKATRVWGVDSRSELWSFDFRTTGWTLRSSICNMCIHACISLSLYIYI